MLKVRSTPNLYGVTLMGDYDDLDKLYDSISNYLAFYQDNSVWFPYHEYEYMLSLNYDIRHCYQGDRGYEAVDNCADRFEAYGSPDYGLPAESRKEYRKLYKDFKNGNLYYKVEILYPLILHYMITFEQILEDEPTEDWLDTENEIGDKWSERYSMIDAMRDKAAIGHLVSLLWENLQDVLGREKAAALHRYYITNECPIPSAIYCDALVHCQLVNFEKMTRDEKLDYLLAAAYEIMGIDDIEEYPDEHEEDAALYNEAIAQLNAGDANRFPVRQGFYEAMDEAFDPSKPMYRNDFDQFLNDKYGIDPDPFETGDFNW